jgi:hypothetical protein
MSPCYLPGDFDGSGAVDGVDALYLAQRLGTEAGDVAYHWLFDLDDDGDIDLEDLAALQLLLRTICP